MTTNSNKTLITRNMHPSDQYLLIRKHIFSIYRKAGLAIALKQIDKYYTSGELNDKTYKGLRAELGFFNHEKKKYGLRESLDSGNHADFIGMNKGRLLSFDVTTNASVKKLKTYDCNQKEGEEFIIAQVNPETLKVEELFDIQFPACSNCGGKLIDVLILMPSGTDNEGIINYNFSQKAIQVCPNCHEQITELNEINYSTWDYNSYLQEISAAFENGEDDQEASDLTKITDDYSVSNMRFYKKHFGPTLMGCGSPDWIITDPRDGDGYHGIKLYYVSHFVSDLFPERTLAIDLF